VEGAQYKLHGYMGNRNEDESLRLCNTIDDERMKDDCFLLIAENYNKTDYCSEIEIDSKRDMCYMYFMNIGDHSVCEEFTNVDLKRLCESIRQMDLLKKQQNITVT